jgi:DNA-binding ferritin-like protein
MCDPQALEGIREAVHELSEGFYDTWGVKSCRTMMDAVASELLELREFPPTLVSKIPALDQLLEYLVTEKKVDIDPNIVDAAAELRALSRRVHYGDELDEDDVENANDLREDLHRGLEELLHELESSGG